jgi:hypothetical protein
VPTPQHTRDTSLDNPESELSLSFGHALQLILAAAFGAWAWVVKVAAHRHLQSQDKIMTKLEDVERRLTRVETKMSIYHHEEFNESTKDTE